MIESSVSFDNNSIRREWHNSEWYYSSIDVLATILNTDYHRAQNYYHVLKNHFHKNNDVIPSTIKIKVLCADSKLRFTDFTNAEGVEVLQRYLEVSLRNKKQRIEKTPRDEVRVFHPKVMAHLKSRGWTITHHLRLLSGGIIDLVAGFQGTIYVIECKPELSRTKFYTAVGQTLCYTMEANVDATPAIASYRTEFDDYIRQCCTKLGIMTIEID